MHQRLAAAVFVLALVAAACGNDEKNDRQPLTGGGSGGAGGTGGSGGAGGSGGSGGGGGTEGAPCSSGGGEACEACIEGALLACGGLGDGCGEALIAFGTCAAGAGCATAEGIDYLCAAQACFAETTAAASCLAECEEVQACLGL
ncbi:hypothetical protein [Vulgatibacter sp.]|uniref:hypothetical protein n=1 Tax=Vulgatibacter sp. TaxID=1971226 RepID=UPI0035621DD7